jgi:hypothetical protein
LQVKRIALLAVLGLLVAAAAAVARTAEHHPTTLTVESVDVSPDGTITASGTVDSDRRLCKIRFVVLKRAGEARFLDMDVTSLRGHIWALRSKPGVADGSKIVVVAQRLSMDSVVLGGRHVHHRRVVCDRGSTPVSYIE